MPVAAVNPNGQMLDAAERNGTITLYCSNVSSISAPQSLLWRKFQHFGAGK